MKKLVYPIVVVVLAGVIVALSLRKCPEPPAQVGIDPMIVLNEYFDAIQEGDVSVASRLIFNWNELDENSRQAVLDNIEYEISTFEYYGGITEILLHGGNFSIDFVLQNGDTLQHRQPLLFGEEGWRIRP